MNHRYFLLLSLALPALILSACTGNGESLKVTTFNVRYDNPGDSINRWSNRLPVIQSYFESESPDIIGMQEVLINQLNDLKDILPGYKYVGVGRSDGKEGGEFCPVFYRADAFELMAKSHFWLSESPDVAGSKSWGAHLPRITTWLKLKNLETGHIFFFFNTHLSHVSEEARKQSVALLLWKMHEIAGKAPVILTGDFNSTRDTETYSNIIANYDGFYPLWDAEKLATGKTIGGEISYNGFNDERPGTRIDFIFVNGYFDVLRHRVDEVKSDGVFISDHYPVSATIKFSTQLREKHGDTMAPVNPFIREKDASADRDDNELLLDNRTMFF